MAARDVAIETGVINRLVHKVLLVGLALSTLLLLAGIGLILARHQDFPAHVLGTAAALHAALRLDPRGLFSLGLLALIATPALRVVGSIGAFLYERDLKYAIITTVVLIVLTISALLGRG